MLSLYRAALRLRRAEPGLGDGPSTGCDARPTSSRSARGDGFACVVNLGDDPVALPATADVLLASAPLDGGLPARRHRRLARATAQPADRPDRPDSIGAPREGVTMKSTRTPRRRPLPS